MCWKYPSRRVDMRRRVLACIACIIVTLMGVRPHPFYATAARPTGGTTALLLRYRFAVGQHFAYRIVTATATRTEIYRRPMTRRFAPLIQRRVVVIHDRVVGVAPTGVVTIAERAGRVTVTHPVYDGARTYTRTYTNAGGRTRMVTIAPDGTQHPAGPADGTGAIIDTATFGTLPPGPVRPGATWTAQVPSALTGRPLAVRNTFVGLGYAHGEPVAIVDSVQRIDETAPITVYMSVAVLPPQQQAHEVGTVTERALVGLMTGHLLSRRSQSHLDLTFRARQAGLGPVERVHVDDQTIMERLGS